MSNIGERMKWLRKEKCKKTQEEIGKIAGVGKATIMKYEKGIIENIPPDRVELLAKALETSPAYIMGWTDDPDPNGYSRRTIEQQAIDIIHSLPDSYKYLAVDYLRYLAERAEKGDSASTGHL